MANRTMAAKALKLRRQNRALPRRLSINGPKGPRPATEVLQEYRSRARSLGVDDNSWKGFDNTPAGRFDIEERAKDILGKFDNPLFVEHIDNPAQRIRIFFNSRQDSVVIQRIHKQRRVFSVSIAYTSIDDAYFVLAQEIVEWRIENKPFPDPP